MRKETVDIRMKDTKSRQKRQKLHGVAVAMVRHAVLKGDLKDCGISDYFHIRLSTFSRHFKRFHMKSIPINVFCTYVNF